MDAAGARMTRECAWHVVLLSTVNQPIASSGALGRSGYEDVVILEIVTVAPSRCGCAQAVGGARGREGRSRPALVRATPNVTAGSSHRAIERGAVGLADFANDVIRC